MTTYLNPADVHAPVGNYMVSPEFLLEVEAVAERKPQ